MICFQYCIIFYPILIVMHCSIVVYNIIHHHTSSLIQIVVLYSMLDCILLILFGLEAREECASFYSRLMARVNPESRYSIKRGYLEIDDC